MFLVISTSLSTNSRSRILAKHIQELLEPTEEKSTLVDLADVQLPRCDAGSCYESPAVQEISGQVKNASGIVIATPIYNYTIGSELKNLIELTGQSWAGKTAGFLCAAGGLGSYMGVMGLANSLMLDFRTFILPQFVYATGAAFAGDRITDSDLIDRLERFSKELQRVSRALAPDRENLV